MRVAIRTDASERIGTGHVMRCLSLARTLRHRGAEVRFLCRPHPGHLCELIEADGFTVARLGNAAPPAGSTPDDPPHATWLGSHWQQDIEACAEALHDAGRMDWLIADHYALERRWESAARRFAHSLMVIDDLADRPHDCDVLLDQTLQDDPDDRYAHLLPAHCIRLLGPRYALLREEFALARRHLRRRDGRIRRILVSFGGTDPSDQNGKLLDALEMLGPREWRVELLLGLSHPHADAIRDRCRHLAGVQCHERVDDVAQRMAAADLAIGAGGITHWERCCMALPALVITVADNQLAGIAPLVRRRAVIHLGHLDQVGGGDIARMLARLAQRPSLLRRMGERAAALTDGLGAQRVADRLWRTERETVSWH